MSNQEQAAQLRDAFEKLMNQAQTSVKPIVPASVQPLLAVVLTAISLIAMGAFAVVSGKSIAKSIALAGISSLAGGFAIVFICNSLGVYV